jgi:hypothetical protein
MLVGMLHQNEHGLPRLPRTLLIESSWVEGNSVKKQAKRASKEAASPQLSRGEAKEN